jgi:hypothetical protein
MLIGFYPRGRGALADGQSASPPAIYFTWAASAYRLWLAAASSAACCRLGISLAALAGSSFASAERMRSSHGAWGNLSPSMTRRIAAVTAVCCSSVKSVIGMLERDVTSASRHA